MTNGPVTRTCICNEEETVGSVLPEQYATGIRTKMHFYNTMHHDVVVSYPSGMKFTVHPCDVPLRDIPRNGINNGFLIQHEITIPAENVEELIDYVNSIALNDIEQKELLVIVEACRNYLRNPNRGFHVGSNLITIRLDYYVNHTEFSKLEHRAVLIRNLGIQIQETSFKKAVPHPFSSDKRWDDWIHFHDKNPSPWSFGVEINDNTGRCSPKFISIGGIVKKILPTNDPTRPEGIFVRQYNSTLSGDPVELKQFQLDQCQEAGLYNTYEEAITLGNPKLVLEEKIRTAENLAAELRNENNLQAQKFREAELKLKADNLQHEKELGELKQEMQRIQHEYDQYRANVDKNRLIREEYYSQLNDRRENDNADRKSSLELLKWVPAVFATVIGVAVAVAKAVSTTKLALLGSLLV